MRVPLPLAPDLLTPWRQRIQQDLEQAGISTSVGPKRPSEVENREGCFVRIMCLGGPWRARALWYPRLATESWAPTVTEARRLDAVVARATARLLGFEQRPTPTDPVGFFISDCSLDLQGADQSVDGRPFVLTTTGPLCVQVIQLLPKETTP